MLSEAELARYNRQLLLPELGLAGQERLKRARVLVIGVGGLGSPVALYLAAAGVGTLGLVDSDSVEPSNLHRQVLHGTADVGTPKTESATAAIARLNDQVKVEQHHLRLDTTTAAALVGRYDLIVDGSDNHPTRYAVNDACAAAGMPWVYGSVERFSGQVAVFGGRGPCYRCVFPEPPAVGTTASCEEIGVLGAVAGVVGTLQATEALKLLTGIGDPLFGRLLQLDLFRGDTKWIRFDRRLDCPTCGNGGQTRMNESRPPGDLPLFNIEPGEVRDRLTAGGARLLDIREPWEVQRAAIAGALELPMSKLEERLDSLSPEHELIVFCHHGSRSRMVTEWLRSQGYRARNLNGGIDRWSREVDAGVPRY